MTASERGLLGQMDDYTLDGKFHGIYGARAPFELEQARNAAGRNRRDVPPFDYRPSRHQNATVSGSSGFRNRRGGLRFRRRHVFFNGSL